MSDCDEPVMMRFSAPGDADVPTEQGSTGAELEKGFEAALAQALNCDRERVSWFEGSGEEQLLRVDFCLYAADEDDKTEGAGLSCAVLAANLADMVSSGTLFEKQPSLAALRGATLAVVGEDEEDEEFVDESTALELLDAKADALSVVRQLFVVERLQQLRLLADEANATPSAAAQSTPAAEAAEEARVKRASDLTAARSPELHVLTPSHLLTLERTGYVVVDGALSSETAAAAGVEAIRLARMGSGGGFGSAGLAGHDASVRDDVTCFLSEEALALKHAAVQAAAQVLHRVHEDVSSAMRLRYGPTRAELQLAVYDGQSGGSGARYERHRDGFPSAGTRMMRASICR